MWIVMILSFAVLSVLTIIQIPREWLRHKPTRILLIVFHTIGIASLVLILFVVYRMEDGLLREIIVWTETCYFTVLAFALLLAVVRYLGYELARHFKHRKILWILNSSLAFFLAVGLVSAAYMVPSVHGATTLRTVAYDIHLDKSCEAEAFSIAVISDFHVGAGARHSEMDQMVERVAEAKPELILIAGDVCDSASSEADLEYMEETLKKLSCPYGVYYAEGNHEVECRIDPEPYLLRAGITILKDEGVRLENGVNIVGRKNDLKKSVGQIVADCGLDPEAPTVVVQHRALKLNQIGGEADVALCGHTHGYQFPFFGVLVPHQRDITYGHQMFGDTHVIVSAGVSEWGYRTKWPSQSEVTMVNLSFQEAEQ